MPSIGSLAGQPMRAQRAGNRSPGSIAFLVALWLAVGFAVLTLGVLIVDSVMDGAVRLDANLFTDYSSQIMPERAGARAAILGSAWVIAVTAALAIMTLIVVEVAGMRTLGAKGYLGTIFFAPQGMGPVGKAMMLLIMTPVEFLGKLTKPFALAIRLFANMNAGHFIILALIGLIMLAMGTVATLVVIPAPVIMAVAIAALEIFVAFLQAYIFAMLSSVFIGLIRHAH